MRRSKYIIIQARMGSTRLPGKVMKQIQGIRLISYQVDRLKQQLPSAKIIVATTTKIEDDEIVRYCEGANLQVFRGAEQDVLARFFFAAQNYKLNKHDLIIRVTADCPLVCPELIEQLLLQYDSENADYGRIDTNSFPRGVDAEVFTFEMLSDAYDKTMSTFDREHVTPYFYNEKTPYRVTKLANKYGDHSGYRFCIDEIADYHFVSRILKILGSTWRTATYQGHTPIE